MHKPLSLPPAEAARRLGVSPKALRLYEQRGLIAPGRTGAGWRVYDSKAMARARDIVALRRLGLSLDRIGAVLGGSPEALLPALDRHREALEDEATRLAERISGLATLRAAAATGSMPTDLSALSAPGPTAPAATFDLPWPWAGAPFALSRLPALGWITGPLGSGKTRLAEAIAHALPGGSFLGLDRFERPAPSLEGPAAAPAAAMRDWLTEEGAAPGEALAILAAALHHGTGPLVVDLVEQGLDPAGQTALAAWLRARGDDARPLFLLTRSNAMLDLDAMTQDEMLLYCPANHSPPVEVAPWPGAPGREAAASCLAPPEARARTRGLTVVRTATG